MILRLWDLFEVCIVELKRRTTAAVIADCLWCLDNPSLVKFAVMTVYIIDV